MSKTISIRVASVYRGASATMRARVKTAETGRGYLSISARSFRAAEARCAYAGTDGIDIGSITRVEGYSAWAQDRDGNLVAWAL